MELIEYEELLYEFLHKWDIHNIENMTLQEYVGIRNRDTFCQWIETKTRMLGSIKGMRSIMFGIYERKESTKMPKYYVNDNKYSWLRGYGDSKNTAFENIKKDILKIIDFSQNGKFEQIDNILLSNMFKWKIAYLYSNERLIPIFSTEVLLKIASHYGLKANNKTPISQIQNLMILNKPAHLNVHEFMKLLCSKFIIKKTKNNTTSLNKNQNGQKRIKRKASDRKNTNSQKRTINRSFLVEQKHNKIQEKLKDLLIEQYGKENVILEENYIDVKVIQRDHIIFYEVKSSSYASECIKEALGQILLYSFYDNDNRPKKHIVVGQFPANDNEKKYIEYLKLNLKLEFDYMNIDIE